MDRKVPFVESDLLLGNLRGITTQCHASERWRKCYEALKHEKSPIGGVFFFTSPVALALDLDFLRNMFVKDFQYFRNHGVYVNERDDPLTAHLFSIEDDHWKHMRTKLTPTFTSGKIKGMFPIVQGISEKFKDNLLRIVPNGPTELEIKELLCHFTIDIIGSAALGIDCNSMKNPEGELRQTAKLIFGPSRATTAKLFLLSQFPDLGRKLKIKLIDERVTTFLMKLVAGIVENRERNPVKRHDFMDLLLQLKNTGRLEGESSDLGTMTMNELAAQVFIFFFAGFETSSSTMTFFLYEMAKNPDVQAKVRQEIEQTLAKNGGEMTYDVAMELHYLDQAIQETLRKYPIVDTLFRKVSMPYRVGDSDVVLEKDTTLIVSVLGIHRDPEIYPDPEKFDPDRFTKKNIAARHPYAWIPFGRGPRECIGMRFGMMQIRLGICSILRNFQVTTSAKTPERIEFVKDAQLLAPQGGMHLKLTRL